MVGTSFTYESIKKTSPSSFTFLDFIVCTYSPCCCSQVLSHVCLFVIPWTVAPLPMEFSRQEYYSGVLFPSPGDLPDPGIKPMSLVSPALAGGFFTTNTTWEALGGEWIHVYECPFNAHPKLSQQCLLISYTPIQNFFLNPH